MKKLLFLFISFFTLINPQLRAQDVIAIDPLFEYPMAPEELNTLEEKCNFIVKNFWNDFNFKNKATVDQNALNHAFMVYASSMPYASDKEVMLSVNKLLDKLSGNPTLLRQFCKAAEENLYGPRAQIFSDDIFMKFLEAFIKNKKIPVQKKTKYTDIYQALSSSRPGKPAPEFSFTDKEGGTKKYFPMSTPTLLIFGDPDDTDWRLARLKMDSDIMLSEALEKGKANIIYIVPFDRPQWQEQVSNYNKRWTVGQSSEVAKFYDIRFYPSMYLVDADGKIEGKNISLIEAINFLTNKENK